MRDKEETGGIGWWEGCLGRCRPSGPKADVARDAVSVGEAVVRVLERIEAHLSGAPDEQVSLPLRVVDALAGDVEILGFALDADEVAAHLDGCHACGSAAHKGVTADGIWCNHVRHSPLHQVDRLLCRMRSISGSRTSPNGFDARTTKPSAGKLAVKADFKSRQKQVLPVHNGGVGFHPCYGSCAAPGQSAIEPRQLPILTEGQNSWDVLAERHSLKGTIVRAFSVPFAVIKITQAVAFLTDRIRHISNHSINLAERRQHFPAIAQIQRGASDGFKAGHSERPHSISPGLREAKIKELAEHFVLEADDLTVELVLELAGRAQATTRDNHWIAQGFLGKSALAFGQAGEAHHRLVSAQWRIQRPMQEPRASATSDQISMMVIGCMGVSFPQAASTDQNPSGNETPRFAARRATP